MWKPLMIYETKYTIQKHFSWIFKSYTLPLEVLDCIFWELTFNASFDWIIWLLDNSLLMSLNMGITRMKMNLLHKYSLTPPGINLWLHKYPRWPLAAWNLQGRIYVLVDWKTWVVVSSNEIKTADEEYSISVVTVYFCLCYLFCKINLFKI